MSYLVAKKKAMKFASAHSLLLVAAVPIALLAGLLLGMLVSGNGTASAPTDNSVEAGFARDMSDHHSQGVEMGFIIRENQASDDVRTLAFDIINTQSVQKGMMSGWLNIWGLPQTSTAQPMSWIPAATMKQVGKLSPVDSSQMDMSGQAMNGMDMSAGNEMMPGMATEAEMQALRSARGKEAEVMFLRLMIRHHQGGVQMARAALDLSDNTQVRTLARTIVNGQTAEIEAMRQMLKDRGVL